MEGFIAIFIEIFTILTLASEFNAFVPRSAFENGRIVGGRQITIKKVPYQVSIAHIDRHICGGSLIKDYLVLSAAHCFEGLQGKSNIKSYRVYAGINTVNYDKTDKHAIAEDIVIHKLYDSFTMFADIALVKFSKPFELSEFIGLIPLSLRVPETGDMCLVTGWGATEKRSNHLMGVEVPIIDWKECHEFYENKTNDKNICAGFSEGGKDSCQGDSGGPLAYKGELVGVVSWGYGCARANQPGVYTSVAAYIDWIQEHESPPVHANNYSDSLRSSSLNTLFTMSMLFIFHTVGFYLLQINRLYSCNLNA